jgi:hypothetical protein
MTAPIDEKKGVATPQPREAVSPTAYNTLVAAARLRDIRLLKSEFSLDPEGVDREDEWKLSQSCEIKGADFIPESNLLMTFIDASASCKIKNKKVIQVRSRYLVVYDLQGSPSEAAVDAFAKRVARFAAYPYFRAHVAEIGSQAGVRLPPLPMIKEVKVIPKAEADGVDASSVDKV